MSTKKYKIDKCTLNYICIYISLCFQFVEHKNLPLTNDAVSYKITIMEIRNVDIICWHFRLHFLQGSHSVSIFALSEKKAFLYLTCVLPL